ncbi:MAG: flagellar hook-associated protein FlgK [Oscillospiraceae bacterium]|nr:flagellar hook-associated protein FlgK [Oscillospiraceae bacterium]MCL2126111.1 flagellar hook-associated protein FlgK [Oscillospiraceae bacterium]
MRATFAGIEIGRTGLNIAQLGLDVTGHNIANVETEGYTRQRIVQTAYDPFATIGRAIPVSEALVGGGVRVKILDQIRSAYLDRRYRTENTINAYWLKRTEGLTYLESYFDNVVEETSLNFSIGQFFKAIKVLAEDPVEGSPRKLLQTAGNDLAQQLHSIYEGLIDLQDSQNQAVKVTVEDINRIANEIVELNKSIYGFEVTGYIANDLRDKRNLLLDELSALIDIEYREESDGKGGQKLVVEIGGRTLLDHDKRDLLDVELRPNSIAGEADVWAPIWAKTKEPGMDPVLNQYVPYFRGLDGSYTQLMQLYAFNPAAVPPDYENVDMQDLKAVQSSIDRINEIAARFAKITPRWEDVEEYQNLVMSSPLIDPEDIARLAELSSILEEPLKLFDELNEIVGGGVSVFEMDGPPPDWDWCVHTGLAIGGIPFVYACSDDKNAQSNRARVSIEPHNVDVPAEDLIVKGGELKAYLDMRDNYEAGTVNTPTPGIPYYIEMLNNLARSLVQEVNAVHREGWNDNPNGSETGINFFDESVAWFRENASHERLTANDLGQWIDKDGNVVADPDGDGFTTIVYDLSQVTAKNIRLSREVAESEYNIACSTKEIVKHGEPDELQRGNNENMNLLYELFLKKDINMSINGKSIDIGSFDGFITSIRFDVANTLSFAKKTTVNSTTLLIAAENQRISVSGVSLDEEMVNMVKYQHAYSGASRVITAMDEALDRLINNTGRVGL